MLSCSITLALSPTIGLRDASTELIVTSQIDVVQVQSIQQTFILNLTSKILYLLLNVPFTHVF